MRPNWISKRSLPIVVAALTFAVAAVVAVVMIGNKRATLSELRQKYQGLTSKQTPTPPTEIHEVKEQAELVVDRIVGPASISELLTEIGAKLAELDTRDRQITTESPISHGVVEQIPISVRFKGGFRDARAVIREIERHPQLIRVDRMLIKRDAASDNAECVVDLSLSTFSGELTEVLK